MPIFISLVFIFAFFLPQLTNSSTNNPKNTTQLAEKLYTQGIIAGKKNNGKQSLALLIQAAKLGHVEANYALGWLYYYGKFVTINYPMAAKYILFAATKGLTKAQRMAGMLYSKGHGVSMDRTEAFRWLQISNSSALSLKKN